MAKLADAPDLGSGSERSEGSSPFIRTKMVLFVVWAVRQVSSVKLFGGDGLLLSV